MRSQLLSFDYLTWGNVVKDINALKTIGLCQSGRKALKQIINMVQMHRNLHGNHMLVLSVVCLLPAPGVHDMIILICCFNSWLTRFPPHRLYQICLGSHQNVQFTYSIFNLKVWPLGSWGNVSGEGECLLLSFVSASWSRFRLDQSVPFGLREASPWVLICFLIR